MAEDKIDVKLLKGLKFSGSKVKTEKGKAAEHVPFERQLTPDDVLDWKDQGETVVIVTTDGRKHTIEKNPKAKVEEKAEEKDKA